MTSTRLRWAVCAALLSCALLLTLSLIDEDPPQSAAAPGEPQPSNPSAAPAATPSATPSAGPATTPISIQPTAPRTPTSGRPPTWTDTGPPVRPDASLGLTVGAAEALTRFYFERAENYLKLTGDGSSVRTLASPVCRPCLGEIAIFSSINSRNKRLTGDFLWKNIEVRGAHSTGATSTVVAVDLTRGKHTAILKPGAKATRYPGGPIELNITLIANNGNWLIFDKAYR